MILRPGTYKRWPPTLKPAPKEARQESYCRRRAPVLEAAADAAGGARHREICYGLYMALLFFRDGPGDSSDLRWLTGFACAVLVLYGFYCRRREDDKAVAEGRLVRVYHYRRGLW